MRGYRFEVHLSQSNYVGDRDERLTEFIVAGESEANAEDAIRKCFAKMAQLGYSAALAGETAPGVTP